MGKLQKNFKQKIDLLNKRDIGLDDGYYFNQTDINTATIVAQITSGSDIIDLTGASVSLSVLKPNKDKAFSVCDIIDPLDGKVLLNFTRDMLDVSGLASFQVTIQKGTKVVVSNTFYFSINNALIDDADIGDIENMPLLVQLQAHANNVINNESKIVKRVENIELKTMKSEEERIKNEQLRIENEKKRETQEKERQAKEQSRIEIDDKIQEHFLESTELINNFKNTIQEHESNMASVTESVNTTKEQVKEQVESLLKSEEKRKQNEKNRESEEKNRIENEKLRNKAYEKAKDSLDKINAIADETNLSKYVDEKILGKADKEHKHTVDDITDLNVVMDTKAEKEHIHGIESITGLIDKINSKADLSKVEKMILSLQTKGDYITNTEFLSKLEKKLDTTSFTDYTSKINEILKEKSEKGDLDKIKSTINSVVETELQQISSNLEQKSPLAHQHTIFDISDLGEKLNEKAEKTDLEEYVLNEVFKSTLEERLKNLADNEQIKGIISTLSKKSNISDLEKYQLKGNYALKDETNTLIQSKIKDLNSDIENKISTFVEDKADITELEKYLKEETFNSKISKYVTTTSLDDKITEKINSAIAPIKEEIKEINESIEELDTSLNKFVKALSEFFY